MPVLTFELNPQDGTFTYKSEGIDGPGCADVAKMVKKFVGEAAYEGETPEYARVPKPTVKLNS